MATFIYQAKNEKNQIVSGIIEAADEKTASQALLENKLRVTLLEPRPMIPFFAFLRGVNVNDKAVFIRQLSTMLSAGLHLPNALNICLNQTNSRRLKEVLGIMIKDIEAGYSLSAACAKHPDIFNRIFISAVKTGETAGKLDQILLSLADRFEKDASFSAKVKGALIYPMFIFTILIIVGTLMMIKVVPNIQGVFEQSGVSLPWMTAVLVFISNLISQKWWLVLTAIAVLVAGLRFYARSENGLRWWNELLLSIPVFGELNKAIIMARFTQTFSLLVKSGIPILDALESLAEVMDNEIYRKALYKAVEDVEKGIPLSVPLSKDKNFPPIVSQMIGVGEQSGTFDQILERLGNFYEEEVDRKTKILGSLIEPIVIVILGLGVAMLVFGILLPIYDISSKVR